MTAAGPVYLRADALVREQGLPDEAVDDVTRVLDANRGGAVAMLLEVALAAGLERTRAIERCAALFFHIGALQIADDIADGDCDYLALPAGSGTAAQYILQNLFWITMASTGVPVATLIDAGRRLVRGAGPQHIDVRTSTWTESQTRSAAEGFGVDHCTAYFTLLLCDTPHAARAAELGRRVGFLAYCYADVLQHDRRLYSLPPGDRERLLREALAAAKDLEAESWPVLTGFARLAAPVLRDALAR